MLLSVWTGAAAGGGAASCRWVDQPQERPVAGRTAGVGGAALAMGSIPGGVASCGISALAMASPLPFNRAASQPGSRGWGWAASRGRGCAALGQPLAPWDRRGWPAAGVRTFGLAVLANTALMASQMTLTDGLASQPISRRAAGQPVGRPASGWPAITSALGILFLFS